MTCPLRRGVAVAVAVVVEVEVASLVEEREAAVVEEEQSDERRKRALSGSERHGRRCWSCSVSGTRKERTWCALLDSWSPPTFVYLLLLRRLCQAVRAHLQRPPRLEGCPMLGWDEATLVAHGANDGSSGGRHGRRRLR